MREVPNIDLRALICRFNVLGDVLDGAIPAGVAATIHDVGPVEAIVARALEVTEERCSSVCALLCESALKWVDRCKVFVYEGKRRRGLGVVRYVVCGIDCLAEVSFGPTFHRSCTGLTHVHYNFTHAHVTPAAFGNTILNVKDYCSSPQSIIDPFLVP